MDPIYVGFYSVLPPLISIVIALIFKEILLSLLLGVFSGSLIYCIFSNLSFVNSFEILFNSIYDNMSKNVSVIVFTCFLGAISRIIIDSGGINGYAHWANKNIKSPKVAQIASIILSMICSIDDTFLSLTVGNVMRKTMDRNRVSRARFAHVLDMLAAQLPILMPVSSWAASIAACIGVSGLPGMKFFLNSIAFNFYPLFSFLLIIFSSIVGRDFSKMSKFQKEAIEKKDSSSAEELFEDENDKNNKKGSIWELLIPILALLAGTLFMTFEIGGAFSGVSLNFSEIMNNTNFDLSVNFGALVAVFASMVIFIPRRVKFLYFTKFLEKGMAEMVSINAMLALAWSMTSICCSYLSAGEYISSVVSYFNISQSFLPFIFFILSSALSFSVGSSWATFGILIPIVSTIISGMDERIISIVIAAVLSGSICGSNASPISSTAMVVSAGTGCKHLLHIYSQIPYVILLFTISSIGFIIAPIFNNVLILYAILLVLMCSSYFFLAKNHS